MCQSAETFSTGTLPIENRSPYLNIFSFSRPDFEVQTPNNELIWRPRLEVINFISSTRKSKDFSLIDGETWIASNTIQYQLNENIQVDLTIPWISHGGGISDRFIYQFHNVFQLPQNGRTKDGNDDMRWLLHSNNEVLIDQNTSIRGVGDISAKVSWTTPRFANTKFSGKLKLPTGSLDKFTGSEEFDFGISVLQYNPPWFESRNFWSETVLSLWYGLGYSVIGKTKLYDEFKTKLGTFTARIGAGWMTMPGWQIKMQLDSNSPLFETKIRELGWYPIQFSIGSSHKLGHASSLDLVIVEDLRPRSAPDVIFSIGFNHRI